MTIQLIDDRSKSALFGDNMAVSVPASTYMTRPVVESLRRWFGADFAIVDADSGECVSCPFELVGCNWELWGEVCRSVARLGRAEIIADEDACFALAIPVVEGPSRWVAVGVFHAKGDPNVVNCAISKILGCTAQEAQTWLQSHTAVPAEMALRLSERFLDHRAGEHRIRQLQREVEDLSVNLSNTYEEISLLYRLTQNLKLSSRDEELGNLALGWLADVLPAESLAIQFRAVAPPGAVDPSARTEPSLLVRGHCPLDCTKFTRLVEKLAPIDAHTPLILHGEALAAAGDVAEGIKELLIVTLSEGQNTFGYLAAFNHLEGKEFGTVEASLVSSVAAILGIHSGNSELYRQQRDFLRNVVRALTSAIDAKDPYTCGHSDRVARVAVCLAEQLGCEKETLNTIYLSGLLHDIGKIGIDDNVLRKPGKLTDIEYEHIKLHSEIGYRILKDLRQLDEVLPVVLHHHEQWDGRGYPHRLSGEDIPFMARIVAVADAFDAMGSDRPYRQGMPEARLDQVLRDGAGSQWDPVVVDAFFQARKQIREIFRKDREPQREMSQWI
jgi:HD-GYP domain-containing protein (c-di-GMP phosphodiesterase class II)